MKWVMQDMEKDYSNKEKFKANFAQSQVLKV